jgi:hypothetical protein
MIVDGKNPNTFLVWIELYLAKIWKKSRRGESGSVTITETGFSAGLARVKAKILSGSGRVSRVRSGPGRVTGLRHFPYLGAVGLARLG